MVSIVCIIVGFVLGVLSTFAGLACMARRIIRHLAQGD